ncbi:MAG: hypothetical protein EBZ40_06465, partial [Gammaproteobacteria bacterium]|nr:hypothetical protein [Gammaproteobacteria bacterium]
ARRGRRRGRRGRRGGQGREGGMTQEFGAEDSSESIAENLEPRENAPSAPSAADVPARNVAAFESQPAFDFTPPPPRNPGGSMSWTGLAPEAPAPVAQVAATPAPVESVVAPAPAAQSAMPMEPPKVEAPKAEPPKVVWSSTPSTTSFGGDRRRDDY